MERRPKSIKQAFSDLVASEAEEASRKNLEKLKNMNEIVEATERFETQIAPILEQRIIAAWNEPVAIFLKEASEEAAQLISELEGSRNYYVEYRTSFSLPREGGDTKDPLQGFFSHTQGDPLHGQNKGWAGWYDSFTSDEIRSFGKSVIGLESHRISPGDLSLQLLIEYSGNTGNSGADRFVFNFEYEPATKKVTFGAGKEKRETFHVQRWPEDSEEIVKRIAKAIKTKEFYYYYPKPERN